MPCGLCANPKSRPRRSIVGPDQKSLKGESKRQPDEFSRSLPCVGKRIPRLLGYARGSRLGTSGYACPHTLLAVSTTNLSLRHCSSSVSRLPSIVEAKPHWGLRARFSSGTYLLASSMRLLSWSCDSSSGSLLLMSPSTTVLSRGTKRKGSNVPARSDSYSSRNESTCN